jgi:hypothetical protein
VVPEQVRVAGLTADELGRVLITRADGVHTGPLAEFALFGLLACTKGLPRRLARPPGGGRTTRWPSSPGPPCW